MHNARCNVETASCETRCLSLSRSSGKLPRKRVVTRESLQVGANWPSPRFSGALRSNRSRGYAKYFRFFHRECETSGLLGGGSRIRTVGRLLERSVSHAKASRSSKENPYQKSPQDLDSLRRLYRPVRS